EVVVRGDDGEAAGADVLLEQPREECLSLVVERGERLVERPQARRIEREPCEPDAAALSRGKAPRGKLAAALEADLRERLAHRIYARRHAAQRKRGMHVLLGGEVVLDSGKVPRVEQLSLERAAGGARVGAVPEHLALVRPREPGDAADERRLA